MAYRITVKRRLLSALLLSALFVSGCSASEPPVPATTTPPSPAGGSTPTVPTTPTPPAPPPPKEPPKPALPAWVTPVTDQNFSQVVAQYHPNELGQVLILEYHHFGLEEDRWTRTYQNFRKDLETLYAKGFRAVNLGDYLKGEMKLPVGTSPVIFTFDDSPKNQLRLIEQNGTIVADPQTPVAIMLQFAKEQPDFGVAGTFFVKFTEVPFEEENWKEKLKFLVANGFEVGNHSYTHDNLTLLDDRGVQRSLAMNVKRVKEALPDYDGWTLALPLGLWPKNHDLAVEGEFEGTHYKHRAVLLVADSPVPSPYDKRQDPFALQRTQAIQSEFDRWFRHLANYRYVSDGDPATVVFPESYKEHLNPAKVEGKQVRTYPDTK